MNGVRDRYDEFCRRLDALSQRERLLVMVALLGVITLLWYTLLAEPLNIRRQRNLQQADSARAVLVALEKEQAALVAANGRDADAENRRQVALLQNEVTQLDERLAALTGELINPRQMASVLEEMLQRRRGLSLIHLENLPSEPLLGPPAAAASAETDLQRNLYRHPLRIELTGSFLEALAYLQALENLPRKVYWQDLQISVEDHPRARISVTVYTLSLKEGWIGV